MAAGGESGRLTGGSAERLTEGTAGGQTGGTAPWADQPVAWPCRRVKTTEGILMDFVVDQVDTPGGATMVRNYLRHPDAVGIIALDDQGRVAVERQYRHPVRKRLVEAPAGLCDHEAEAPLAAAQRELAEELGLAAATWAVLVDVYGSPGSSTQATRIFLARDLSPAERPEGFVLADEEADMDLDWADLDDLVAAVLAGQVMNPTMVCGVMALKTTLTTGGLERLRPAA